MSSRSRHSFQWTPLVVTATPNPRGKPSSLGVRVTLICEDQLFLSIENRAQLKEFRQPLQVQSHLEMPRILVQLGHTQRTWKLAPQTDPKWSRTWSLTRFQPICPLSSSDGRYACQVSRAHRTHSRL